MKAIRMLKTGSAALLLTSLAACAQFKLGQEFDLSRFETQVERGVTTQAQVKEWLGDPVSTGAVVDTDGKHFSRWIYYSAHGQLSHMDDAKLKSLEIQFDEANVVQGYNWVSDQ